MKTHILHYSRPQKSLLYNSLCLCMSLLQRLISFAVRLHSSPAQTPAATRIMVQFTAFEVGQIKAHAYHGMSGAAISRILFKPTGTPGHKKETWSEQAVQDVIKKLRNFPGWRGERDEGSGTAKGAPMIRSLLVAAILLCHSNLSGMSVLVV